MTSDQREKKPLSCGTAQNISHLRLRYPLGTWNTRVSRRFGRIRELPLLLASRLQGQDPPSLGWTYYDSLGPASDGPAVGIDKKVDWNCKLGFPTSCPRTFCPTDLLPHEVLPQEYCPSDVLPQYTVPKNRPEMQLNWH